MSNYQRAESRRAKLECNLHLLELDNADRPDDLFMLLNLGGTLLHLARPKKDLAEASPDQVAISLGPKADSSAIHFPSENTCISENTHYDNQFVHSQKLESRS